MECTAAADCGVPVDVQLEFRFDRYLRPNTATRQSVRLYAADTPVFLEPEYDPVERVVIYRQSPGTELVPGIVYTVELPKPDVDETGFGFRAYDGAGLRDGNVPLTFRFRTSAARQGRPTPEMPSCEQVLELFGSARAGCARSDCHGTADTSGRALDLSTAEGLLRTAIGRTAHETETGTTSGEVAVNPDRFGVAMPVIARRSAGASYLLYKLLRQPENFRTADGQTCVSRHTVELPPGDCLFSEPESERLADAFVVGAAMPPPGEPHAVTLEDLERLRRWINQGASMDGCQ